jgi:hypothetical protein
MTAEGGGRSRSGHFRRIRILLLLGVLAIVLLYAFKDVWRRRQRTSWREPVNVAFVLLRREPANGESGPHLDPAAVSALGERVPALEQQLATEYERYGGRVRPFSFQVYGPVDASGPPPSPESAGWFDLAENAVRSWFYFRDKNQRAELPAAAFDSIVYLVLTPPRRERVRSVEGQGEQGGRVGSVEVELDDSMLDFALFVATHELFHTLGATDKYDAAGNARVPDGLAEPERVPLYPQLAAEVMARNVVLAPGVERPPETLAELRVGRATAREIGWAGNAP